MSPMLRWHGAASAQDCPINTFAIRVNYPQPYGAFDWQVLGSLGRLRKLSQLTTLSAEKPLLLQETLTSIEASSGGRPTHDRRNGSHHGSNPGIDDADSLQWCVTTGIQENVEDPQSPCEWVHSPGQKGHSWHSTTGGKRHG